MTKSRIMQILPALGDGGVERGTIEMAAFLQQRGLTNIVVSAGGRLVEAVEQAGSRHIQLAVGAKSPLAIWQNARKLAALIDNEGIDILHARSRAPAWAGYWATRMARRKVGFLTTFHGVYGHSGRLKRIYNGVMLKGPMVVANSAFIRDHIIAVYGYPADRIIVAPRGVEPEQFDPAKIASDSIARIRVELGGTADAPLIVIVGRVTDWKGHRFLVEALARSRHGNARLAIVGSGQESTIDSLKNLISACGLTDRVRLCGSRSDIPAVLSACDIAVSASVRPEAFGRVAIEAEAMARPIIATAHGGSLETVIDGKTGLLVPPGNADAMAEAIDRLLDAPDECRRMGEAGRSHVLAHFTTQNMLEQEFSAYQRLEEIMNRDGR
ncbi:glycosyltransferase family 4 protein [Martelella alba]|uniref:Glycosyltransferase family 4 protein n=1 Tax=Martelella alba TaxID=2590451 RepID=A0A506UBI8_9HYPH|nr:glycosyltransferase family 4 protein [Martelella alba]TPW31762.1 glycosyltransferase family 4 protein [Martelella alba]